jgi:hypothetical protein
MYKAAMLELAREVLGILEEEARSVVDSGWAEVRLEEGDLGETLHLEPMKLEAAPIELYFDSDELIVCTVGRNGMIVEFFSEDPDEIKRRVRTLVTAVMAGTYSERTASGTTEMLAEWPGPDGTEEARRAGIENPLAPPRGWRTVSYEPY